MRQRLVLIIAILLFVSCKVFAFEIPPVTSGFYVNDFADILSPETESMIRNYGERMYEENGIQMVVSTVKTLNGIMLEEYSGRMSREYKVGSEDDNGILVLLAVRERDIIIKTGSGLEKQFNDSRAGRLIDSFAIPYLRNDKLDEGISNLYRALLIEFGIEGVELLSAEGKEKNGTSPGKIIFMWFLYSLIIFIAVKLIGKGGGGGGAYPGGYGGLRGFGGIHGLGGGLHGGGGASRKF